MKHKLFIAFKIILTLAVLTGLTFFIIFQVKMKRTIVYVGQRELMLESFLKENFPDQVKTFETELSVKK